MNKRILVTGIGGPAGRSAVTYLKEKGFSVIGTDVKEVEVEVDACHIVPMALNAEFPSVLLDVIKKERPSLFIPTVTEELLIVSRLKKEIERDGCAIFISPPEAVEIANDKLKTALFMKEKGVAVPLTFNEKTPRERIIKELGLPLLSKPIFGRGGRGVTVYRSKEDVYNEKREGLIFQKFIPGDEFDVNLFIGKGGDALATVVLQKTLLKDGIIGNALKVERVESGDVAKLAMEAAALLRMEGPLDFDIRLRQDGAPVLLEINARLGGNVLQAREILDALVTSWKEEEKKDVYV